MARVALLIPAETYRASDFSRAAAQLEVEVVVVTDRPQVLGHLMGGRAVTADLADPDAAAAAVCEVDRELPLDAVVAVDDVGLVAAAVASETLGLGANPPSAVAATRDKIAQRHAFAAAEVPQPAFAVVEDAEAAVRAAAEIGLPVVVKPPGLSASRGVQRADDPAAVRAAVATIRESCAHAGPLLVERFVPGGEVAVEAILTRGRLQVIAVFDKPDAPQGPTFEETMLVTPSRLPPVVLTAVEHAVGAATASLGLREGPIHAEVRVGPTGDVSVLEVAARTIGGLCSRALRLATGRSLEEVVLAHAAGIDAGSLDVDPASAGVVMLAVPAAGIFVRMDGLDTARSIPGITGIDITVTPGAAVVPLPRDSRYLGFVFARGPSPRVVEATLRAAVAQIGIVIA